MEKPKSPISRQIVLTFFTLCCVFMAGAGFLGLLGNWGDSSSQKWFALMCAVLGLAGAVLLWKLDEISDEEVASVTTADEVIKLKSGEEQRRYWRKERQGTLIGALVVSVVLVLVWLIWGAAREYPFFFGYIGLSASWYASKRWLQIAREIGKLPRQ